METFKADRQNDPALWNRRWVDGLEKRDHTGIVNPYYPTDGRDTIYDPYEKIAPTKTVGEYLAAFERVENRDAPPEWPKDFGAYLSQRTEWPPEQLRQMPPETALDRRGRPMP